MKEKTIKMFYPHDLLNSPIINQLIQRFPSLGVNILNAVITPKEGIIELQLIGEVTLIEHAISWLKELGMKIK